MMEQDSTIHRKQQYEVRFPSHAFIRAIFTPPGRGGDDQALHQDAFIMDSYDFMTPIDASNTPSGGLIQR